MAKNKPESTSNRTMRFILFVQALIFVPMILSVFYGCAHTLEQETIHDTDTVIAKDTIIKPPPGSVFVRFVSMLRKSGLVILKIRIGGQNMNYTAALSQMTKEFIPVRGDTTLTLYAEYLGASGESLSDSISIPGETLGEYSLTTIALFQVGNGSESRLFPYFANDSMKNIKPQPGYAYFRLINGLPDYPQPTASVIVSIDDAKGAPLFQSPTGFQEINNYTQIPIGTHIIYIRNASTGDVIYQTALTVHPGQFYSARLSGAKSDGTDSFVIDLE